MRKRVLISSLYNRKVIAPPLRRLSEHAEVVMGEDLGRDWTEDELITRLEGIDAVIAAGAPYTARVFQAAPQLGMIARDGVGFDNIDLEAATRHGVIANNAPVVQESVADLTFGLIIAVMRKILTADQGVRQGRWADRDGYVSVDVNDKTLGIVGLGRVGRAVARRASGFNMTTLAYDIAADTATVEELGVGLVDLDELLSSADVLCLHTPLTPQTCNMIDAEAISKMKDGAYLMNMARGAVVDETALIAALKSGKLAGAGLDVLREEPPRRDHPLLQFENVVFTPHIGGDTLENFIKVFESAITDILLYFAGETPRHVLNPEVFSHSRFTGEGSG